MPDLQLLEYAMIPATSKQSAFQFGKLLAHFPRRDVTKDAIIISDLSGAIVSENLSLIATARVCSNIWKEATNQNPFLPPTGQILRDIREQTERYRQQYERLKNPKLALPPPESKKPDPPKYGADSWSGMSEENRQMLISDLKSMMPTLRRILKKSYGVPDEIEINPEPEENIIDKNLSIE